MPGPRSYRAGALLLHWYGNPRSGCRTLQDFKKISILEVKGYCYGWHFYQAADADLVISSDDALFGHPAFRYVGLRAADVAVGDDDGDAQVPGDGLHRSALHCRADVRVQLRQQRRAPGGPRGRDGEVRQACARTRPTDTVFMQKVFFEIMKQHQGEYMGSMLSAWLESMGGQLRDDDDRGRATLSKETMDAGLNVAVKSNDDQFPPEWRLSRSGRRRRRLSCRTDRARPRSPASRSSTSRPGSAAPTARSCWPTAVPRSSRWSRPRAIRCGGGRPPGAIAGGRRGRRALQLPGRLQAQCRGRRQRRRGARRRSTTLLRSPTPPSGRRAHRWPSSRRCTPARWRGRIRTWS